METLEQLRYRAASTGTGTLVVTIEQLNAIHADAQVTIAALQKEIATRDSTDSILATRIRELEARLTQRTEQVAALQARVREYREQIELLQGMLVSYRLEVDSLRTQQRGLMSDEPNYTNMIKLELQIADLQSQLTQRTAELEAAKKLGVHLSHCNFGEHVDACKYGHDNCPALSEEWSWFGKALEQRTDLQAELERVRDQYADLRKMVLALPKVEGEITVKQRGDEFVVMVGTLIWLKCYKTDEILINAIVALWQHRQGMEG